MSLSSDSYFKRPHISCYYKRCFIQGEDGLYPRYLQMNKVSADKFSSDYAAKFDTSKITEPKYYRFVCQIGGTRIEIKSSRFQMQIEPDCEN